MTKRKIVRFEEDGECWVGYENKYDSIVDTDPTPTLKEFVDLCDLAAESRNNHGFVCVHRLLAKVLIEEVGEKSATNVLRTIAEYGGLDGMNGCNGEPDAYSELGLKRDWGKYAF